MSTTEASCVSVAEAARTLGLSEAIVYPRVWDGSLPIVRLSEQDATGFRARLSRFPRVRHAPSLRQSRRRAHGGTEAA